ncbi:hypothetical protein ACGK9R_07665 [Halomonas sp. HNIBRBA4712]|uniref:hypothetical protein n=1 Tax=Halomonas sp. HNIBRBA4712 TaxID=3373087 RepID=UPI00374604C1
MIVGEIKCADDMAFLASESVKQVRVNKQYRDLISAILMANHIADWHYIKDLGLGEKGFGKQEREKMKQAYPEWDILRKLANGTKHCKLQASKKELKWEDFDFWNSPGHVGEDWLDWFVDFDDRPRSVIVLIESFLKKFSDKSSRPAK